jgi:hypothetical protein
MGFRAVDWKMGGAYKWLGIRSVEPSGSATGKSAANEKTVSIMWCNQSLHETSRDTPRSIGNPSDTSV